MNVLVVRGFMSYTVEKCIFSSKLFTECHVWGKITCPAFPKHWQ
jgi:hypothetical protein